MSSASAADTAYYEVVAREEQERVSVRCATRAARCAGVRLPLPRPPPPALSNLLDVTQSAFRACVHSFLHHELTAKEEKCVAAVTKKYVATSVRATSRLAESQAAAAALDRAEAERALEAVRAAAAELR